MVDPTLQQQIQHSKQLKYKNQQLSTRYTKYLEKSISLLLSDETDTKLLKKIDNIYNNQSSIERQYVIMRGLNSKLNQKADLLQEKLNKGELKLVKSNILEPMTDFNDGLKEKNKVQLKTELLDQQIRILENCSKLIITNDSQPVGNNNSNGVRKGSNGSLHKRGLFG